MGLTTVGLQQLGVEVTNQSSNLPQYKDPPRSDKKGPTKRRVEIVEKILDGSQAKKARQEKAKKKPTVRRCTLCRSELHDKKSCPEVGKMAQPPLI